MDLFALFEARVARCSLNSRLGRTRLGSKGVFLVDKALKLIDINLFALYQSNHSPEVVTHRRLRTHTATNALMRNVSGSHLWNFSENNCSSKGWFFWPRHTSPSIAFSWRTKWFRTELCTLWLADRPGRLHLHEGRKFQCGKYGNDMK